MGYQPPKPFTYYDVDVRPVKPNSMGLRYEAWLTGDTPTLRADTKEGMKELIRHYLPPHKLRTRR